LLSLLCSLFPVLFSPVPARAVNISTHSFSSCGFPDTGQKICYGTGGATISPCPAPEAGLAQDGTYIPSAAQPKYTVYTLTGGSLVTVDDRTGLMWLTNPSTNTFINENCDWKNYTCSWGNAIYTCENLNFAGYEDWRLPNVRELTSIVNYGKSLPSVNTTAFPGIISTDYWTSTPFIDGYGGWYDTFSVNFSYGSVNTVSYGSTYLALQCVRGGP